MVMKNLIIPCGGCCWLLAVLLLAQVSLSSAASLWQVEGGTAPVVLAGSVHLLRQQDRVPEVYEQIYRQSAVIVFEVEPHHLQQPEMQQLYVREGRCEPGKRIQDYLSAATGALLEKRIRTENALRGNANVAAVYRMKPWMAGMFLTLRELTRLGADPERGLDQVYFKQARNDQKRTGSLEDAESHIRLLSGLTRQEQDVFLKYTLLSLDQTESMYEKLLSAWQQGDEKFLAEWFRDSANEDAGIIEKVLLNRNRQWMEPLEQHLSGDEPVMVIVGVGHLVGAGSVVDLLKRRGYTIRQLK
jgi:hypothetical protein